MARFAKDCLRKFSVVTRKLECTLGPDTSGLAVRIGLHSGAITGGVLRGERARFQLFGDTVSAINVFDCFSIGVHWSQHICESYVHTIHTDQHGGADGEQWRTQPDSYVRSHGGIATGGGERSLAQETRRPR